MTTSIDENYRQKLEGFIAAEERLGTNFREPKQALRLINYAAELDLDRDFGLLGEWKKIDGYRDEETYDRLIRACRLDAAKAQRHAEQAHYYARLNLEILSRVQYLAIAILLVGLAILGKLLL